MRDALSILDQLIAGCEEVIDEPYIVRQFGLVQGEVYVELNEAILQQDSRRALKLLADLMTAGQSLDVFAQGIVLNFRNLLLVKIDPELADTLEMAPEQVTRLTEQAARFQKQDLLALLDRASQHYERFHRSTQPRILLEAALVEYTLFESRVLLSDLVRRLQALEQGEGSASSDGGASDRHGAPVQRESSGRTRAGGQRGAATRSGSGRVAEAASHRRGASERTGSQPSARTTSRSRERSKNDSVAAADTIPGWTGFIQVLLEVQPGLAACLMDGLPSLDSEAGRLVVAFPPEKDFQLARLRQELPQLQERVAGHWGRPLQLTVVTTDTDDAGALREDIRRSVAPTEKEVLAAACRSDRPLADLVDLLQGEPIPLEEQDSWLHEAGSSKRAQSEQEVDRTPAPDGNDGAAEGK